MNNNNKWLTRGEKSWIQPSVIQCSLFKNNFTRKISFHLICPVGFHQRLSQKSTKSQSGFSFLSFKSNSQLLRQVCFECYGPDQLSTTQFGWTNSQWFVFPLNCVCYIKKVMSLKQGSIQNITDKNTLVIAGIEKCTSFGIKLRHQTKLSLYFPTVHRGHRTEQSHSSVFIYSNSYRARANPVL